MALLPSAVVVTLAPSAVNSLVDSAIAWCRVRNWQPMALLAAPSRVRVTRRVRRLPQAKPLLFDHVSDQLGAGKQVRRWRRRPRPPVRARFDERTPLVETSLTAESRQFSRTENSWGAPVKRVSQGNFANVARRIRLSAAAAHGASKHKRRRRTARRDGERRPLEKSYKPKKLLSLHRKKRWPSTRPPDATRATAPAPRTDRRTAATAASTPTPARSRRPGSRTMLRQEKHKQLQDTFD